MRSNFRDFCHFCGTQKNSARSHFCDFCDFLRPFGSKRAELERCVTFKINQCETKTIKSYEEQGNMEVRNSNSD